MTCGIYRLIFKGTDKVYIGQSKNIEHRFIEHISRLTKEIATNKLMAAYYEYGLPSLDILVECSLEELDREENEAIIIWDSYNNGFNSRERAAGGGKGVQGTLNGKAIYTEDQIVNVFNLIVERVKSVEQISIELSIDKGIIWAISRGVAHLWLKDKYPDKYKSMEDTKYTKRGTAEQRGIIYPILLDPDLNEYIVKNVRAFAKGHNLDSGSLNRLLNKKVKQHKNWTVK